MTSEDKRIWSRLPLSTLTSGLEPRQVKENWKERSEQSNVGKLLSLLKRWTSAAKCNTHTERSMLKLGVNANVNAQMGTGSIAQRFHCVCLIVWKCYEHPTLTRKGGLFVSLRTEVSGRKSNPHVFWRWGLILSARSPHRLRRVGWRLAPGDVRFWCSRSVESLPSQRLRCTAYPTSSEKWEKRTDQVGSALRWIWETRQWADIQWQVTKGTAKKGHTCVAKQSKVKKSLQTYHRKQWSIRMTLTLFQECNFWHTFRHFFHCQGNPTDR